MKWFKSIFDRRNEEEEAVSKVSPSIALVPTEDPRPQSLTVPSGKVLCKICGKPMLAMTAERAGTVCMPCSQSLDAPPSVATPALTDPLSAGLRIRAVHLLVESPALALAAGAVLTLPRTLFSGVDEELAGSGYISNGELLRYIEFNGYSGPAVESSVGEAGVRAYAQRHFGGSEWACCRRMSELAHYYVLVAFK